MEYDADREYGICEYCGTKLVQEKIVVEHRTDESGKYKNYLSLADRAFAAGNYKEARDYYTRVLEISSGDNMVVFRKAICTGYLSGQEAGTKEVIAGVKSAYQAADSKERIKISDEIEKMISEIDIKCPYEFKGAESCEKHTESVLSFCEMAYSLYEYTDRENRSAVEKYCNKAISVCDLIKPEYTYKKAEREKTSLNLSIGILGIDLSSNVPDEGPQVYKTPQPMLERISSVRKFFLKEKDRFIIGDIEAAGKAVDEAKQDIKKLPAELKILHGVFSIPMLAVAVFISIFLKPVPGLVLLAAEIICYFVYIKMDFDGKARDAYANYRHRNEEYIKNKKQQKQ